MAEMESHYDEFTEATVYAANFSAQGVARNGGLLSYADRTEVCWNAKRDCAQSIRLGQAWGAKIGKDLKKRMIDAMRKKGYNI